MFWNKKQEKKERLPDLPGNKITRFNLPPINSENPSLNIKEVDNLEEPFLKQNQEFEASQKTMSALPELPVSNLPKFKENRPREIPRTHFEQLESEIIPPQIRKKEMDEKEPIFVRLDKFRSAKTSLSNIREKLNEIDELLRKIRETRQKEEQELEFWEKETHEIQDKLNEVTESIFEKIE